ncbi:glycosyltransferase [Methylobacterium iners]|uniref:Glycosyl transferase n=1 Tax=Methylobacterium iners TaxID=418707 RepID=A0ABQ4S662_9HYPH|nr:glycosyltransferase [Methylobacterium iners]GJD97867.1 hypothetical protein OCOJLMKI_5106 [Methylobacterium iners]
MKVEEGSYLRPLSDASGDMEPLALAIESQRAPIQFAKGETGASRPLLVCFSHLRWGFVWQRPQHLLCRAAGHFDVLFIEEPVFEAEADDQLRIEPVEAGVTLLVPVIRPGDPVTVTATLSRLIRTHLERLVHRERLFWYYTPAAVAFSDDLPRSLTVYDNMDELSAFRGASPDLIAQERSLLNRADLVFTGGRSLYDAKRDCHRDIHCFPSSVDAQHFRQARSGTLPDPADQAGLPRPRLGFFGVIDERFDQDFLAEAADLRPDWQWVMIGPVVKIDPATLPQRENIHWLGPKSYKELPAYLGHWDLGVMPFARNESTRFISPTKTPEFLAAGLPVISTPIVDVVRDYGETGLAEIADKPMAAVLAAEALLARPRQPWLERVDRQLAANSWDQTWDAMRNLMLDRLSGPVTDRERVSGTAALDA